MKTAWPVLPAHSGSVSFVEMARDRGEEKNRREAVDAAPRGAGCHLGVREN